MDFPKKQAQRLIPLYLLEYNEELFNNHPDPSASWGGDYTAGYGIDITNNEISVDTDVIATKSDITSMVTTTMLEDALDDYALKTDLPENVSDLNNDVGYITGSSISNCVEIVDVTNGFPDSTKTTEILANPSKYVLHGTVTIYNYAYHIFATYAGYVTTSGYTWMQMIRRPDSNGNYKVDPYGFAVVDGTWVGPYKWGWGIDYYNVFNKPTFAAVATSGSYNDLSDKPTIPTNYVTTDTTQTVTGAKTFQGGLITENTTFGIKMNVVPGRFAYTYDNQGTIESTLFDLPTSKTAGTEQAPTTYTLATTDDIPDTTNLVTTNTAQTISGTKTFTGNVNVASILVGDPNLSIENSTTLTGFSYNSREFELPVSKSATQGTPYTIATTDDIPTVNNPTITFTQGGTTKGTITLNQSANQTIALDAGGGGTLSTTSETLTFTYADNTTGTLTVITSVTLS